MMHWQEALNEWYLELDAKGLSERTKKTYRKHISLFSRYLREIELIQIKELNPFLLRRFLSDYAPGHSPASVKS